MPSLRKIRGLFGNTVVWSLTFALVSGVYIAHGALRGLLPPLPRNLRHAFVLTRVGRAAGMGAAAGVAFSILVMLAERRRSFADRRTTRFAAWGFVAGAGSFLLAHGALAVRTHTPIDANLLVWSAIYGAVGASAWSAHLSCGTANAGMSRRANAGDQRCAGHLTDAAPPPSRLHAGPAG